MPPLSKGANNPAVQTGYSFHVSDVDNVPDLHGNPADARLVIFIGGNQFFALRQLVAAFEKQQPELKGHIFYDSSRRGKQISVDDTITLGNLTLQVKPDVYEAGAHVLHDMEKYGQIRGVVERACTNALEGFYAGNHPLFAFSDLARPDLLLSMPNPQGEGVSRQIADSLRKAGGESLEQVVYQAQVKSNKTLLTEIHHR